MKYLTIVLYILLYSILTVAFLIIISVITALAIGLKLGAILVMDRILDPILFFGDFCRSLEITEIFNVLVFAILGLGFGLATILLPEKQGRKISASFLVIIVPIVFFTTPMVRYDRWLKELAENEKMSPTLVKNFTDYFLRNQMGYPGFLGYYLYSAKYPILPTTTNQLYTISKLEKQFNTKFIQYTGISPTLVAYGKLVCNWVLRLVYLAIAITVTTSHFHTGLLHVKR